MHSLLQGFLLQLEINQRSPRTLEAYQTYLTPWIEVRDLTEPRIRLAEHLKRYLNPVTKFTAWTHIRAFERWCIAAGFCADWLTGIKIKRPPVPHRDTLTPEEFQAIMAAIPRTPHGRRNRALFSLIYYTGARRKAIVQLRRGDLNIKDRLVRIHTKGDKCELLPIARPGALAVNLWLPLLETDCLFPSMTRIGTQLERHVHLSQVTHLFPRYARAAGITKRAWVHGLRHSHAQHLSDNGEPLEVIAAGLGITLQAAAIYSRTSRKRVADAQDRAWG